MEFVVGDIAELKSGGPMMTVVSVGEEIGLVWYSEEAGEFRRASFPAACLEKLGIVSEDDLDDEIDDDEIDDEDDDDEEEEKRPQRKKR